MGEALRFLKTDVLDPMRVQVAEMAKHRGELEQYQRDSERRISDLEKRPWHVTCISQDELTEHDRALEDHGKALAIHGTKIDALSKWRAWLMGAIFTAVLAACGSSGAAIWTASEANSSIRTNTTTIHRNSQRLDKLGERFSSPILIDATNLSDGEQEQLERLIRKASGVAR